MSELSLRISAGASGVCSLLGAVALSVLLAELPCRGDTVLITAWDVRSVNLNDTNSVQKTAAVLAELNPDVLLLQGVPDWAACDRLAQAFTPPYHVLVCSSFASASQTSPVHHQTAILAKQRAYAAWAEPWRLASGAESGAGLVFAAIQSGNQRLGFFSMDFDPRLVPPESVQQVKAQLDTIRHWTANQVQSVMLGFSGGAGPGSSARTRLLKELGTIGFNDALEPLHSAVTSADCLLGDVTALPLNPRVYRVPGSGPMPVTCDFEVDPAKVAAARVIAAERQASGLSANAPIGVAVSSKTRTAAWAVPSALAGLIALAWLLTRRKHPAPRAPALLPQTFETGQSTSYTVVVTPPSPSNDAAVPDRAKLRLGSDQRAGGVLHVEPPGLTHTESAGWQRRALLNEADPQEVQRVLREGLLPDLRRWLKHIFVRKLVADRANLLEAQQTATRKAMLVDERLARIELQLQEQNQAYQRRIDELTRELVAAKEESRELIRARIAQVKTEMELARARVLAQAREENL